MVSYHLLRECIAATTWQIKERSDHMRKSTQFARMLIVTCLLLGAGNSYALFMLVEEPSDTKLSPNQKYVLVMLSNRSLKEELERFQEHAERIKRIRSTYKESGLYLNDDTHKLLWRLEWYDTYVYDALWLSDNGKSLIRLDNSEAKLHFYVDGKIISEHRVPEMSSAFWHNLGLRGSVELNDQQNTFDCTSNYGDRYSFDINTGAIITRSNSRKTYVLAAAILVLVVGVLIALRPSTLRSGTRLKVRIAALILSFFVIFLLYRWTHSAFYPPFSEMEEALAKPWRPWARLMLSAIVAVVMLLTQAYLALRRPSP